MTPNYLISNGFSGGWAFSALEVNYYDVSGDLDSNITESKSVTVAKGSITISNFYLYCHSNTLNNTATFTFRKNGADTDLKIQILTGQSGLFKDDTHSISLVEGDTYCIKGEASATAGKIYTTFMSHLVTGDSYIQQVSFVPVMTPIGAGNHYIPIGGFMGNESVEAKVIYKTAQTVVYSRLSVNVPFNSCDKDSYLKVIINGVPGNQSVFIPAGTTGFFVDDVNTDTIEAGDTISYVHIIPDDPTGYVGISIIQMKAVSTGSVAMGTSFPIIVAPGTTTYTTLNGNAGSHPTTEAYTQVPASANLTAKHLFVLPIANTLDAPTTITFRKNGVDTSLSVTIGAGETAIIQDTTNTVDLVETDVVNYKISTGATSGQLDLGVISVVLNQLESHITTTPVNGSRMGRKMFLKLL